MRRVRQVDALRDDAPVTGTLALPIAPNVCSCGYVVRRTAAGLRLVRVASPDCLSDAHGALQDEDGHERSEQYDQHQGELDAAAPARG